VADILYLALGAGAFALFGVYASLLRKVWRPWRWPFSTRPRRLGSRSTWSPRFCAPTAS